MSWTNCQNDCEWNPIARGIAVGKMRHYLSAAHQDKKIAIEMFHLDGAVAASFLEPIRLVELVLREAIHRNMTNVYGSRWMYRGELIDARSLEKVTHSANRIGKNPPGDKLVSDLSLGFWLACSKRVAPLLLILLSELGTLKLYGMLHYQVSSPMRNLSENTLLL